MSILRRAWETLLYPFRAKAGGGAKFEAELLAIALCKDVRGLGYGRMLIERVDEYMFSEIGIDHYSVCTFAGDPASNGFYRSCGFSPSVEFTHHENQMRRYVKTRPT